MSQTVLLADDDDAIRTVLTQALMRAGYEVRSSGTAAMLWRAVAAGEGDVVVSDVVLPDENAFELLPRMKKVRPDLPVIVMSAKNTIMTAITAAERGAFDYLPKPFDLNELLNLVGKALEQVPKSNGARAAGLGDQSERLPLIGRSPVMQDIYRIIARMTQTDLTVMIAGESGTGKELVARALHDYSKRRRGPVRCHQHGGHPARADRNRSFSATKRAPSPAPPSATPASSSRPRAAPCFSTRSATCRWRRRRGCCACCNRASSRWSAAACR